MKIAVAGGAGFIGSHLTRAYINAGHDVIVIDSLINGAPEAVDPRARFYQLDIRDSKVSHILQQERPDIVSYHISQYERYIIPRKEQTLFDADVHIRGLLHVLDACVAASVRKVIFASGGNALYGHDEHAKPMKKAMAMLTEETPLYPEHPYDISKAAGEWYVRYYTRQYGLEHTILRYADVYGETDRTRLHHPLSYFVTMLLEGHRPVIRGAADQLRDNMFVDDVVRANLLALQRGNNQTFHVSSGCGSSLKQLFQAVAQSLQLDAEPVFISQALITPAPVVLDNTRAWQALGWTPQIDLTAGIHIAIERLRGEAIVDQQLLLETSQPLGLEPLLVGRR